MLKGTVTKVQSYATGNDCGMSLISDDKDKAMQYDKEIVYLYTEEEHLRKQVENPQDQLTVIGESLKTFGMVLRDLEVEWNKFMESQVKEEG